MSDQEKTAAELLAELSADPDFVRRSREREDNRAKLESVLRADEESLVAELRQVGVNVQSVWDLVNTDVSYPNAIQVLMNHLSGDHDVRTKEGIARALTVPEARGVATRALVEQFSKIDDQESQLKWVLGVAIAETSTPDTVSLVVELVSDKTHGKAREMLPLALQFMPRADAESILQELINDPDVRERAIETLKIIHRR